MLALIHRSLCLASLIPLLPVLATAAPPKTLADYLVIAVSPALIMVMVHSVCFFLVEVFYRGEAAGGVRWVLFWFVLAVVLPLIHCGVGVLMIGGNIPGETRLASIAIYNEVEALNYDTAGLYALVLVGISFSILLIFYYLNRKALKIF